MPTIANSTIAWCAKRSRPALSLLAHLNWVTYEFRDIAQVKADALVLESATAQSLQVLQAMYAGLNVPVLLIVKPAEVGDVLAWVRDEDEVCLETAPEELIGFQLRKLLASREPWRDPLTGLVAREDFSHALKHACEQCAPDAPVSLILADLDHFKGINDCYGHGLGDRILKECAQVLEQSCGENGLAARWGGEEFAILLRADAEAAYRLAEQLRWALGQTRLPQEIAVTWSLGIATAIQPIEEEQLFREADEALYAAKAQGRNQSVMFSDLEQASKSAGEDVKMTGLQNRARVLAERVANLITLRSRRIVKEVQAEAECDGLTQCYTRKSFDRRLHSEFQNDQTRTPLTVALVDLDHFGQINKQHGWPTGDAILRSVCDVIRENIRDTDWIGRYGGEEFCIVMPNTALTDACEVLERLRRIVAETTFHSTTGRIIPVTLSIGVITKSQEQTPAELLEKVSQETLKSKRQGRNRLSAASQG